MPTADDYLMQGPEAERYYRATEDKHFSDTSAVGSRFTEPSVRTIRQLLDYAIAQGVDLDSDDHDRLGDPGRPGVYYVAVPIAGETGAMPATDLDPGEAVIAVRTKDGVPPDLVVFGRARAATDVATLVLADERTPDGLPTGRRVLITCHPGPPLPPAGEHRRDLHDNTVLAAAEVAPGETVLVSSAASCLGAYTIEALAGLLGDHPGSDLSDTDAARALSRVVAAGSDARRRAQQVLYTARGLDEGDYGAYGEYEPGEPAMAAINRAEAAAVATLLASARDMRMRVGQSQGISFTRA